jgi:hypothetical protein
MRLTSILSHLLFPEHLKSSHSDFASKRVATEGATVLSGLDGEDDLVRCENGRNRILCAHVYVSFCVPLKKEEIGIGPSLHFLWACSFSPWWKLLGAMQL